MNGQISLERVGKIASGPHVHAGPLLNSLLSTASHTLEGYVQRGGYRVARRAVCEMTPDEVITQIDAAGLRGRAGGGFPAGHKWWLVSQNPAAEKYFICNANAVQPGGFKERFIINSNPHRIVESTILGAFAVGAKTAFIFLPRHLGSEAELLEKAFDGRLVLRIFNESAKGDSPVSRSVGRQIDREDAGIFDELALGSKIAAFDGEA